MEREGRRVDPDLQRATTLPGSVYTDPSRFPQLCARVFAPAWHCLPPASLPASAGAVHPFTLLPGSLDEPLLGVRDADGRERLLSNACTHRGALVAPAACTTRELRCPYHGRRFGLDGRFRAAPGFEEARDFPRAADDLRAPPLAARGPLRFTSLAPALDFAEWAAALDGRLAFLPCDELRHDPAGSRSHAVAANWALYVENYLEGFHVPYVHPGLARALDLERYATELMPHGVLQVAEAREKEPAFAPPVGHPDAGRRIAAYYLWLWPHQMFNFYPWGLSVNVVQPTAADACVVRYDRYVWRADLMEQGAGADLDRVELEDQQIVASVQRGLRARLWPGGRFSPRFELGVHEFQRRLAAALA